MVERDIRKNFLNDLAGLQFDVLLLDLIDERFNLYIEPQEESARFRANFSVPGFPRIPLEDHGFIPGPKSSGAYGRRVGWSS